MFMTAVAMRRFMRTHSAEALLALTMSSLNIHGRSSCLLRELVGIILLKQAALSGQ
jgi:hypothetical protein